MTADTILGESVRRTNKGRVTGPDYAGGAPCTYLPYGGKRVSTNLRDEVYDFLSGGEWPHRIVKDPKNKSSSRALADFAKMARESFMVTKAMNSDGRRTLMHIVRPSKSHEQGGIRDTRYGPRVVPPAKDVDDILAWVRYFD